MLKFNAHKMTNSKSTVATLWVQWCDNSNRLAARPWDEKRYLQDTIASRGLNNLVLSKKSKNQLFRVQKFAETAECLQKIAHKEPAI